MDGLQYLIQLASEPAQNATWVHANDLHDRIKGRILSNLPPTD